MENLLSPRDAADLLGVSERGFFRLTKSGAVPTVRIGRLLKIDPADLRAFIDSCKTGGGNAN
jgi:excisionase family DNA binding protein